MTYLSLEDFKVYYDTVGTADDVLIQDTLDAAQQFIDSFTHRTFESAGITAMVFDPRDNAVEDVLFLDEDLASLTSVTIDSVLVANTEYTTIPLNNTPFNEIRLRRDTTFNWFENVDNDSVSISGDWVFSLTPPLDIVEAMKMITTSLLKERESIGSGLDRTIMSPTGVMLISEVFPKKAMMTLRHYKRRTP